MKRTDLDSIDRKMARLLSLEGRMPVAEIAEKLKITDPTVRSRMRRLLGSGIMRISGLINPFKTRGLGLAIIALTVENNMELDRKLEEVSELPMVQWAAVVTGQYDILAVVTVPFEGTDCLYDFLTREITRIGGIGSFVTFVVLKAKNNWILMPPGLDRWVESGGA